MPRAVKYAFVAILIIGAGLGVVGAVMALGAVSGGSTDPSQHATIPSATPATGNPLMWTGGALVLVSLVGLAALAVSKRGAQ